MTNENPETAMQNSSPELLDNSQENNEADYEEYNESLSKFHRLFDYIQTKKGDIVLSNVIKIVSDLAPAAKKYLEIQSDVKSKNTDYEYKKWWWLLAVRFLVVIAALASAIYLKYTGNLDSTTSLIIVTVATVFFSLERKSNS